MNQQLICQLEAIKHSEHLISTAFDKAIKSLVSARRHQDLIDIIHQLSTGLGLSGFLYLSGADFRKVQKIDSGLLVHNSTYQPRKSFDAIASSTGQSLCCFKTTHINVVVSCQNGAIAPEQLRQLFESILKIMEDWISAQDMAAS